jgi:hypothetical protein
LINAGCTCKRDLLVKKFHHLVTNEVSADSSDSDNLDHWSDQ